MINGGFVPKLFFYLFVIIAVLLSQLYCAGEIYAEGEKIVSITVKGNKRIESAAILNAVKIKEGDTLLADKTDADLRAIYKL